MAPESGGICMKRWRRSGMAVLLTAIAVSATTAIAPLTVVSTTLNLTSFVYRLQSDSVQKFLNLTTRGKAITAGLAAVDTLAADPDQDGRSIVFIGILNPAESRPGGGLLGGYALLEVNGLDISVIEAGPNDVLTQEILSSKRASNIQQELGTTAVTWYDATLHPDFQTTAWVWRQLSAERYGFEPDLVLALDPMVLEVATGNSELVEWLSSEQYSLTAAERATQDDELIRDSVAAISLWRLLDAVGYGNDSGRLKWSSAVASAQQRLSLLSPGSQLPVGFGVYPINTAGNKMDQFIKTNTTFDWESCKNGVARAIIRTSATLDLKPDAVLPDYIARRTDFGMTEGIGNSTNITFLVLGPQGSRVEYPFEIPQFGMTRPTVPIQGRPTAAISLELSPGETVEAIWRVEVRDPALTFGWIAPTFSSDGITTPTCD